MLEIGRVLKPWKQKRILWHAGKSLKGVGRPQAQLHSKVGIGRSVDIKTGSSVDQSTVKQPEAANREVSRHTGQSPRKSVDFIIHFPSTWCWTLVRPSATISSKASECSL